MTTHQFPQRKVEGGGLIAVPCQELMRYSHFFITFSALDISDIPGGVRTFVQPGLDIFKQCNDAVTEAKRIGADWLWIIGDDHLFTPSIIKDLLEHGKDVTVPHCLQRSAPFLPVVYKFENAEGEHMPYIDLPNSGLVEVYAAGSAGMLIRRPVIEAMPERPFTTSRGHHNEDLEFCRHVREAGFTIHCDVDTKLGHVGTMYCIPEWKDDGYGWGAAVTLGPDHTVPFRRFPGSGKTLTVA